MEANKETVTCVPKYSLFSNQTSGHSCMIKVANTFDHILKPLDSGEQKFYELIQMKKLKLFSDFIPKYFGVYYPSTSEIEYFAELARR